MTASSWRTRLGVVLATGFGLGLSPIASGTAGTLLGIPIVLLLWPLGLPAQAAAAVLLPLLAIPICDAAERAFGKKDDGRIVADEYLTFPLCMAGLPPTPLMLATAFLSHRFFDIVKPPPARGLQALKGGVGIVMDDVFSSLYALAVNHAIYWFLLCRCAGKGLGSLCP